MPNRIENVYAVTVLTGLAIAAVGVLLIALTIILDPFVGDYIECGTKVGMLGLVIVLAGFVCGFIGAIIGPDDDERGAV